ncbi:MULTISPECIES: DEAD/DEAH box helicase family protein [unclassified Sporosarcina]|uniref:DEAD/DEAH box helicase family protein n=1 Tax=unclassified Sporosarcina TaxID=2647733 RepID=UPI002041747A|nr:MULTISPECIES: DEAD/DEAH box helicase family protein [unclassified Sporosarcina]GKV65195.1 DNA helicase [Sporosarcina sp. NCCP-2331]GLB55319.1 DNA helicase [Sporosarcina sp. NCCP-2378]
MTRLRLLTRNLLEDLKKLTAEADTIYWMTAFLMESGVKEVLPVLKEASMRGAEIKILTGDYLSITQPDALALLFEELPGAELRMIESGGTSFHPKAYLFKSAERATVIIGSSNLSKSALTSGIEWNLYAPSTVDDEIFETAADEFMKLFLSPNTVLVHLEQIEKYRQRYEDMNRSLPFSAAFDPKTEIEMTFGATEQQIADPNETYASAVLEPRPAQQLALDALHDTVSAGYEKALAVLATGLGKTYLAAFFAENYQRVLFIAHREELLTQAQQSFAQVFPDRTSGIYNGHQKVNDTDFVFASIQTLARNYHLQKFSPTAFDLIVVDEFHHAAAATYERVLNYFKPKFLLGLTATPDRLDNKDVYSLCDGNEAISIHFLDAIRKNWLSPFIYHGVLDETDYSQLKWRNNRYDEEELLRLQLRESYAEAVLNAWKEHKQSRTIGFCSSIRQAVFLSDYFKEAGYRSLALHGTIDRHTRTTAKEKLESGELDIIFTVDLFNEGIDIPSVDTLLFARPTESLTVFTQQIGRGLRIADGKSHCVIIDLIGNYRNARKKYQVFTEDHELPARISSDSFTEPDFFEFHFDTAVINLLEAMKQNEPIQQRLINAYFELKEELGRRPTYLEFHLKGKVDSKAIQQKFGTYPVMLEHAGELSELEKDVLAAHRDWLIEVNRTGMTKSYKMVLLKYMLSRGARDWYKPVTPSEAAPFFHAYLMEKPYRRDADLADKRGQALRVYDEDKVAKLIRDMPMTKWSGSSKGKILFEDGVFVLQIDVIEQHEEISFEWIEGICEYRLGWYFERRNTKK